MITKSPGECDRGSLALSTEPTQEREAAIIRMKRGDTKRGKRTQEQKEARRKKSRKNAKRRKTQAQQKAAAERKTKGV